MEYDSIDALFSDNEEFYAQCSNPSLIQKYIKKEKDIFQKTLENMEEDDSLDKLLFMSDHNQEEKNIQCKNKIKRFHKTNNKKKFKEKKHLKNLLLDVGYIEKTFGFHCDMTAKWAVNSLENIIPFLISFDNKRKINHHKNHFTIPNGKYQYICRTIKKLHGFAINNQNCNNLQKNEQENTDKKKYDPYNQQQKRPKTPFFQYQDEIRMKWKEGKCPPEWKGGFHLTKKIAELWNTFSNEEKEPYYEAYRNEKMVYLKLK